MTLVVEYHFSRGVVRGGARAPTELGRSVNPIQTRGADYASQTTASPPGFKKLSTPLMCYVYILCL